jgi:hypothetical protein
MDDLKGKGRGASDRLSCYVTGQILEVDGGQFMP